MNMLSSFILYPGLLQTLKWRWKMGVLGSNAGVLAWRRTAGPAKGTTEGPQMPAIVEFPQVV
ncbi:MAG: hypothetical protein ABSG86_09915, partial [Thermoguttaceae bacterium]